MTTVAASTATASLQRGRGSAQKIEYNGLRTSLDVHERTHIYINRQARVNHYIEPHGEDGADGVGEGLPAQR